MFHLILDKCPSIFKVKLFIDFEYDFQREANLVDKVIKLLNKSPCDDCSLEEKQMIVEEVYKVTDLKKKLLFLKIYDAAKK